MMYEDVKEWNSHVWLMKEHGDESSWTRNYKIQQRVVSWSFDYWKPLMLSKNDKKILVEEWYRDHTYLIWYDIENKKTQEGKVSKVSWHVSYHNLNRESSST